MKLLIIAFVIFAAEAAKLPGYVIRNPQGNSDTGNVLRQDIGSTSSGFPFNQQQFSSGGVPLPVISQSSSLGNTEQFQFTDTKQASSGAFGELFTQSSASINEIPTGQVSPIDLETPVPSAFSSQISENAGHQENPSVQFQATNTQGFNQGQSFGVQRSEGDCPENQIRHVDGSCVTPEITRNVYVYAAPARPRNIDVDPVDIPLPKVEHNIVFIRTDELSKANDPIVVPPPQRKHIIYVLNKESQFGGQRVIEITTPKPKQPEVYFVNYADGQTPVLPDGVDFETALNSAIHAEGRFIDGSDSFGDSHETNTDGFNTADIAAGFSRGEAHTDFSASSVIVPNGNIGVDVRGSISSNDFVAAQNVANAGAGFTSTGSFNGNDISENRATGTSNAIFATGFANTNGFNNNVDSNTVHENVSGFNANEVPTSDGAAGFDIRAVTTGFTSGPVTPSSETPQILYNAP